jgi:hypothetical protein
MGGTVEAQDHRETKSRRKGKGQAARAKSAPKPPGLSDTPTLIMAVLRSDGALRPEEIRDRIRDRYWPGVQFEAIGPTVWRMWKDGRLVRGGGSYALPSNETPAGETAGASKSDPEVNGADHSPSPPDNGRSPGELFSGQSGRA